MNNKTILILLSSLLPLVIYSQSLLENSKAFISPFDQANATVLKQHIESVADSVRIIGLGEVSHYTKECYELKHEIIKTLIDKGYDALVLEVDFGQALLWNNYLTKGEGNIDELVAQSGWFTYRTQEFKNLLLDIRAYNSTADKPFQVFGMEMTAVNHNLSWLTGYFIEHLEQEQEIIALLKKERTIVAFQSHKPEEIQEYWDLFFKLEALLEQNQAQLIASGGEQDYEIAKRIVEIIRQYATFISHDDFSLKVEFRDQFSSRNVLWCLEQLGEDSQIAIWAHNGHVVKKSVLFNYDILGYYLNEWFRKAYYSIGFTFNEGEFGAFSSNGFQRWTLPSVAEHSLTKALDAFNSPYLLFDIRSKLSESSDPDSPIKKQLPIRSDISESFNGDPNPMMIINLSISYDCLIYIDKTNYPTTIDWDR